MYKKLDKFEDDIQKTSKQLKNIKMHKILI